MPIAIHAIWGCYGFWLPNDPRGSGSSRVWSDAIRAFGQATRVHTRRSVASRGHDTARRAAAKAALKQPAFQLSGAMARQVGLALHHIELRVFALAVMPDHVHVVFDKDHRRAEQIIRQIKQAATTRLRREQLIGKDRKVWQRSGWKVFINDKHDPRRAIRYVRANPVKAGFKPQRWSCVVPYEH